MSRIPEPFGLWTPAYEPWIKPLPSRDAVNPYASVHGRYHYPNDAKPGRVTSGKTARRRAKKAAQAAKEKQRE